MKEPIFNLYFVIRDGIIRGRAAVCHSRSGSDEQKIAYLQKRCRKDAAHAKRYGVPDEWVLVDDGAYSPGLSWESYQTTISPLRGDMCWFEDIFREHNAPSDPLVVITCIVDGQVVIDGVRDVEPVSKD